MTGRVLSLSEIGMEYDDKLKGFTPYRVFPLIGENNEHCLFIYIKKVSV